MIKAILKRVTTPQQRQVLRRMAARVQAARQEWQAAREQRRWSPEEALAHAEGLGVGTSFDPAASHAVRVDAAAAASAAAPDTDGLGDPPQEGFVDRFDSFEPPYRLHLGCGNIHLEGFCNVDALPGPGVDVLDDIRRLRRFPDGSVEEIYTCHVLEHFGHDEVEPLLRRWRQLLRPGGKLRVSVPDIDRIVRVYMKNWEHFQKPGHTPWIGLIYGGQTTPYDFHKTGFNACWLRYLLEHNGFTDCQEYPHQPHFVPGTVDGSLVHEPFGEFLSLNMVATRTGDPVQRGDEAAREPTEEADRAVEAASRPVAGVN